MYDESVTTRRHRGRRSSRSSRASGSRSCSPGCSPGRWPRSARAARRIADGDYAARVPRDGPEELASLADSFNQMAASLERQEPMRRDFIANAAHELRTPLTNMQGYLEALRDGVITADRATYESLHEEAERLVRLSRSLDALAEGDAGTTRRRSVELDLATARPHPRGPRRRPRSSAPDSGWRSDVPPTLPARADPDRLAQVLANLLSNAVRYTPRGGIITVHAERRPADILVSVANTGDGDPAGGPRSCVRAVLSRREVARPRAWRRRDRARDREAARRVGRRPGRGGVGDGHDPLLVQPPRLSRPRSWQTRSRSSPRGSPPSPIHCDRAQPLAEQRDRDDDRDGRPERRREADEPRLRVLEPVRERHEPDRHRARPAGSRTRRPRRRPATRAVVAVLALDERLPRRRERRSVRRTRIDDRQDGVRRAATRAAPASQRSAVDDDVAADRHRREQHQRHDREGDARAREPRRRAGRRRRRCRSARRRSSRRRRRAAWTASAFRRGPRTASTTVSPPYAATTPLTTAIGPMRRPVK